MPERVVLKRGYCVLFVSAMEDYGEYKCNTKDWMLLVGEAKVQPQQRIMNKRQYGRVSMRAWFNIYSLYNIIKPLQMVGVGSW